MTNSARSFYVMQRVGGDECLLHNCPSFEAAVCAAHAWLKGAERPGEALSLWSSDGKMLATMSRKHGLRAIGQPSYRRASEVDVSTCEFEFAHGRLPRGSGSWAFFPRGDHRMEACVWINGLMYGEARRLAQQIAAARGIDAIEVGS